MGNKHVVVGQFEITGDSIIGPAEYMKERGNARLDSILKGTDVLFNMSVERGLSPDVETAILVSLQTDYAGWRGARQFLDGFGRARDVV